MREETCVSTSAYVLVAEPLDACGGAFERVQEEEEEGEEGARDMAQKAVHMVTEAFWKINRKEVTGPGGEAGFIGCKNFFGLIRNDHGSTKLGDFILGIIPKQLEMGILNLDLVLLLMN